MAETITALGLMSGTSMDGIDVALLTTDGVAMLERGPGASFPYTPEQRDGIRAAIAAVWRPEAEAGDARLISNVEDMLTRAHAYAIQALLGRNGISPEDIQLVGFHGQTVLHDPARHMTRQLGDGPLLAELTGLDVVHDFRSADVAAGGQGAPFVPVYHRALVENAGFELPVAVLNLGGVGNVTWIGEDGGLLAFDTGPGNALIDDWVLERTGRAYDEGGSIAAKGRVEESELTRLLSHPYFAQTPPKSLDRKDFSLEGLDELSTEDGAATLTAFTAASVAATRKHLPEPPKQWIVCGGGARNPTLMRELRRRLRAPVKAADELGFSSDFMEAEAFAYLAVRARRGLPLSFPGTTGIAEPMTGGRFVKAEHQDGSASPMLRATGSTHDG